jgi:hypothetical protein
MPKRKTFQVGDRVVITRNRYAKEGINDLMPVGCKGTIQRVDAGQLLVDLDPTKHRCRVSAFVLDCDIRHEQRDMFSAEPPKGMWLCPPQ